MEDNNFYDEEDLVVAGSTDRNWKGIIIAVLVITSVLALIVTSVVLLTPPDEGPRVKGRRFELDDIFGPDFQPYRSNGSWISDTEYAFRNELGGASVMDVSNLTTHSIIDNSKFEKLKAVSFSLSANKKFVLFLHDKKKIHRFSFLGNYTVHDLETGADHPVLIEDKGEESGKSSGSGSGSTNSALQLVKWGPVGNSLVLVHEGDIYLKMNMSTPGLGRRITSSAQKGVIYNGVPDWLYEEEILESNSALWFSNDGQSLLYLTFNDSLVEKHHILQYGSPAENFAYPQVRTLRYPKPGTNNPIVTATVCDLRKVETFRYKKIQPPPEISNQDHYITSAGWVDDRSVGIIFTTRSYNLSIIMICSISRNGSCIEAYRISSGMRGWVDNIPFPLFSSVTKKFTTIAPIQDGDNGFFDHLVLVDTKNNLNYPLTQGSLDVIKINAWDEEQKLVYFIATPASHPNERRLYRVKVEQPYSQNTAECLSCTFTKETSEDLDFSKYTTTTEEEMVTVREIHRNDYRNAGLETILQNNDVLRNLSHHMAFPQVRIFPVTLNSGAIAQIRLLLPPGLREEEVTQYPLILNVYAAPGSQLATDRWGVDFATFLASKKDFIVVQVDSRGSGGRGWAYQHQVYHNLGQLEAEDQIEVVKHLRDSLAYVETNKVGIWGWSYGGFLTASIMTSKDSTNLFQCGASIAPVTKWNLYDSAYTERLMGMPNITGNIERYGRSDVTKNIENLKSKMFYLIHGTGDDNVHIQHSMFLAKALVDKKILFRQQIYPDEQHNLNGAKIHVHRSLEEFFDDCFRKQIPPEVGIGLNKGGKFEDFEKNI